MQIRPEIIAASEQRASRREGTGLEMAAAGGVRAFVPVSAAARETRAANLAFAGSRPSATEMERMLGENDLVDEFYLQRALAAARPVCRVILRSDAGRETGWATGFMVSPRVMLTNWHVIRTSDEARNGIAEFEYKLDIRGNPVPSTRFLLRPDLFYASSMGLDYALVAVNERAIDGGAALGGFSYHRLVAAPGKILEKEWITIIQYPGGQRRQFAIRENQLIDKDERFLWYQSDTAPGSSGAPAFNDSFQVVALHHSGKAKRDGALYVLRDGRRVASLEGVDDSEVEWEKNEGVRVSVMCADIDRLDGTNSYVRELRAAIASDSGHVMAKALDGALSVLAPERTPAAVAASAHGLTIPLQISISVDGGTVTAVAPVSPPAPDEGETEKLVPPPVDPDYGNRQGYKKNFLGVDLPMPEVTDLSLVYQMSNGRHIIPYEHFSLTLHKERRLAVFTASNVDGTNAKRKPEPGLYSRKDLFGLVGKNDRESWLSDPRVPKLNQLPEKFYDADKGAFDKGHIVRREDMCWGTSRAQVVKANADTYHVTNCSPQVAGYNQAKLNGLWGLLEDVILDQAKLQQKFSVFAGPILAEDDRFFHGRDETGPVSIQIPRRFWKIVASVNEGALEAYAFVLEQDLSEVKLEEERFQVTEEWTPYLVPIAELEAELGIVQFPEELKAADQSGGSGGDELLRDTRVKRRSPRRRSAP